MLTKQHKLEKERIEVNAYELAVQHTIWTADRKSQRLPAHHEC